MASTNCAPTWEWGILRWKGSSRSAGRCRQELKESNWARGEGWDMPSRFFPHQVHKISDFNNLRPAELSRTFQAIFRASSWVFGTHVGNCDRMIEFRQNWHLRLHSVPPRTSRGSLQLPRHVVLRDVVNFVDKRNQILAAQPWSPSLHAFRRRVTSCDPVEASSKYLRKGDPNENDDAALGCSALHPDGCCRSATS